MPRGKQKVPTYTSLVLEYLQKRDDLIPTRDIIKAVTPKETSSQDAMKVYRAIFMALSYLQRVHAIDCVRVTDGAWWFALPPQYDQRSRTHDERTPESKPRRRRKTDGRKS